MALSRDQWTNYCLWLKERGQHWPAVRPVAQPIESVSVTPTDVPDDTPAVAAPVAAAVASPTNDAYAKLRDQAMGCMACELWATRTAPIWGKGTTPARVLFLGDYPDLDADRDGAPFAGAVEQLFAKMRLAMNLRDDEIFLTNLVLCHVPAGQKLGAASMLACREHLIAQIRAVRPEVIIALGKQALEGLLGPEPAFHQVQGEWLRHPTLENLWILPTYHPRELLADATLKRPAWASLQKVMKRLGIA